MSSDDPLTDYIAGIERQALKDEDLLMDAGAEIDRLKWKVRNQRRELRRLNKSALEREGLLSNVIAKNQDLERELSYREEQVRQIQNENILLRRMVLANGGHLVSTY